MNKSKKATLIGVAVAVAACLATVPAANASTVASPTNLETNPSFELGSVSGWTSSNSAGLQAVKLSTAPSGGYVAEISENQPGSFALSDKPSVAPSTSTGVIYTASASIAAANVSEIGRTAAISLVEYNSSGTLIARTPSKAVALKSAFQAVTVSAMAKRPGDVIHLSVSASGGTKASNFGTAYVDALSLTSTHNQGTSSATPDVPPTTVTTTPTGPWMGVLQATTSQIPALKAANIKAVTLELGWDQLEPQRGVFNSQYIATESAALAQYKNAGIQVILDTGLQYAPSWVFSLPGQTRFVNQDGTTWTGGVGFDVPNSVFNLSVRSAEQAYYQELQSAFPAGSFAAVRVGGLTSGELSYPTSDGATGGDTMWMYDPAAQAASPVPGWKPGTGTAAQAASALQYYLDSIDGYASWLLDLTNKSFPSTSMQLMMPSWGIRPGQALAATNGLLSDATGPEQNNVFTQGLDWVAQINLLTKYNGLGVAYTTWIDAADGDSSTQYESPIEYMYSLTKPLGLPLAGENTGSGTAATLALSLSRVKSLNLQGLMWMNSDNVLNTPAVLQPWSAAEASSGPIPN